MISIGTVCQAQSMFRGGPNHTGVYSGPEPRQFHRVKWKFPTGNRVVSSPVIHGKVIYFGSDDGNIYAVDAESGRQLWKCGTHGAVASSPAVGNGTLFATSYDGKLYAVNVETGAIKWKFGTEGERHFEAKGLHGMQPRNQTMADPFDIYLSSPVVVQDAVYFGSGDGNLYSVNAGSGELNWKFKTGDVIHASPGYADGLIYFGSWDSYFYAVDTANGKERWRFHGGEDPLLHNQVGFQSSPAIVDGVVYTGCRDSNVYALNAITGKEKWRSFNELSWVNASPAVVQGKVLFATSDSSLFRIVDAATGKELVKQQEKAFMFSSPAVVGTTVLIGVLNGTLTARDLETGNLLWDYQVPKSKENKGWILTADRKFNLPLVFQSGLYETTIVGTLREDSVGSIYSSPLVANGVVYFGSADGYLYAIE